MNEQDLSQFATARAVIVVVVTAALLRAQRSGARTKDHQVEAASVRHKSGFVAPVYSSFKSDRIPLSIACFKIAICRSSRNSPASWPTDNAT